MSADAIVKVFTENGLMAAVTYILLKYILSASDRRDKSYQELLEAQTSQSNMREERLYLQIDRAQEIYQEQIKANHEQTQIMALMRAEMAENSKLLQNISKFVTK